MQYIFKNHTGKVENTSKNLCEVQAINVDDPVSAMQQGFYNSNNIWKQTRLTRINLDMFNKTDDKFYYNIKKKNVNIYNFIYDSYMQQRRYYKHTGDRDFIETDNIINYLDESSNVIGYSKFTDYNTVIDLKLFCVLENKLNITSQKTLNFELNLFKEQDYKYAYLGPSFQRSSIFKSNIQGFEWWTGTKWSTNKREFIKRCSND